MSFKINWKVHIISFCIALALSFIFYNQINLNINNLIIQPFIQFPTSYVYLNIMLFFTLLMIPITVLHELCHGAANIIFKGKVKFGIRGIYAYTQELTGRALSKNKFALVLLAPLMSISVLAAVIILINYWVGSLLFILNLLGSAGDICMVFSLCKYNYKSRIIDKAYGFDILVDKDI